MLYKKAVLTGLPIPLRKQQPVDNPIVIRTDKMKQTKSKSFFSNMKSYVNKDTIERASYGQTLKRKRTSNTNTNITTKKVQKVHCNDDNKKLKTFIREIENKVNNFFNEIKKIERKYKNTAGVRKYV
jgi:hypothetical protein